jgi:hypothetical protein
MCVNERVGVTSQRHRCEEVLYTMAYATAAAIAAAARAAANSTTVHNYLDRSSSMLLQQQQHYATDLHVIATACLSVI